MARAYRPQYPDPIRLRAGETIALGREDAGWPGRVWVTDPAAVATPERAHP
jgi:hypothetical protein